MLLRTLLATTAWVVACCVELHIGGVFPMEAGSGGWAGGQACLPAVEMALEDVNGMNVLPGYSLKLHSHNSKCQPGLATKQLHELLYSDPTKLMLLAGCSPVTTVIAEAAPVWNLVVLSYGASSPALSNRLRFRTLFRTHPTANMQNPTRIKIFERFNWKKITILQSVEEVFTSTAKDLEAQCSKKNIRVERQSFYGDPTDAVKTLKRQDARIIVGLFYVTEARRVLCQAYLHELYGPKYVWFFIGWYADTWFLPVKDEPINCTAEQMKAAAQYHFTTESIMLSRDEKPTISGMTGKEFQERLMKMIKTDPANTGGFPEAPLAYDAIWAVAQAFNCTMKKLSKNESLENFTYNNTQIYNKLFQCVKETRFKGVSGMVLFSDSGDRIARTQIEQLQDGKYQMMGTYDTTEQKLEWFGKERFATATGLPPPDSLIIRDSLLAVNIKLYCAVAAFAVIEVIFAISAFIFNIRNSHRGIIIQSQPQCNNVLIAGCVLCSISLLLMGLPADGMVIPKNTFTLLCHSRISILMVGFTFAYGSMFAKVWIVYRMGATENQEIASCQKADEPIPAGKFYLVIAAFFAVDVVVIMIWIIFDPLQRKEERFAVVVMDEQDVKLIPILELCQSEHHEVWTGIITGYKCLLLVFGLFLTYESRNLKLRFVNDSRFVGLAIYNVAILSLATGPVVTLLIRTQADANFAFVSVTVLLCTYISLGLIFVPKMAHIYRIPSSADDNSATGHQIRSTLTKAEQKRFEQLIHENAELKRQIGIKEQKISECRERLEKRLRRACVPPGESLFNNNNSSTSEENGRYSSPATLTTTALIELQPSDSTGKFCGYEEMENENASSCSDEILL